MIYIEDNMGVMSLSVKRCFDIVGSVLAMVLLSPLFAYICVSLLVARQRPMVCRREMIGRKGRVFMLCEFPVSRFASLPYLWNVLKGDMSIVGPRPLTQADIDELASSTQDHRLVLQMRPGLVSESMLNIGTPDTLEKKMHVLESDVRYLRTRTLLFDLVILADSIARRLSFAK